MMQKEDLFNELVYTKFILYKSLFSNLPYKDMQEIATYLPVFKKVCETGLAEGKSPAEIMERFFSEYQTGDGKNNRESLLFMFIQFIERQVVLFDGLEDAAFPEFHEETGQGTLAELFSLAASHKKEKELARELSDFRLWLVLTAHPTQFYTSQVLAIITDLTELFKVNDISKINRLLLQLSKTPFFKKDKPTPFQEAERLTWYLENIFYHAVPYVQKKAAGFIQSQGLPAEKVHPVQIGFWPGGDRDGNPFVTHEITMQTAMMLKESVLKCYRKDVKQLKRQLTFKKVDELIDSVNEKLFATIFEQGKEKYSTPQKLESDLENILDILNHEHEGIYSHEVENLILKVKLFGFHFVAMDVRQNSYAHSNAVLELMTQAGKADEYRNANTDGRVRLLSQIQVKEPGQLSEQTKEVLETIRCINTIQKQNGEQSLHRYIISNCSDVADMAALMFLFRIAGWKHPVSVDIVPLFETIDDLKKAGETMKLLYSDKPYRAHLKSRGNRQVVMLGFSDGTKDGGYLTANWGIYKAKQELSRVSKDAGVQVVFFDGRGGPAARGGGKAHLFYSSMDKSISMDEIQLTIQGQTISANYGIIPSANYNIEQLLHAGLAAKLFTSSQNEFSKKQRSLIDELSSYSYEAYTRLKQHPLFLSYLEKYSPIKYLGKANIASRPASRKSGRLRYEDLRAITFVGAWYQIKQNVPGFYGMGTALKKMDEQKRLNEVRELYSTSLFFKAMVDNSMMALNKTNFSVTQFISRDKEYGKLWKQINDEYKTCVRLLLKITGTNELMESEPVGAKSIIIREDLVLPLAVIQQYALSKASGKKLTDNQKELYEKMIIRTLYGMTNAGRNSV